MNFRSTFPIFTARSVKFTPQNLGKIGDCAICMGFNISLFTCNWREIIKR